MNTQVAHIRWAPDNWFYLPQYVYIGRKMPKVPSDGYFGNPYKLATGKDRGDTLERFELYARHRIATDPEYRERVRWLHGKVLLCWCAPGPCHGHVLARLAEELTAQPFWWCPNLDLSLARVQ